MRFAVFEDFRGLNQESVVTVADTGGGLVISGLIGDSGAGEGVVDENFDYHRNIGLCAVPRPAGQCGLIGLVEIAVDAS